MNHILQHIFGGVMSTTAKHQATSREKCSLCQLLVAMVHVSNSLYRQKNVINSCEFKLTCIKHVSILVTLIHGSTEWSSVHLSSKSAPRRIKLQTYVSVVEWFKYKLFDYYELLLILNITLYTMQILIIFVFLQRFLI